ncbi:WD40 repeat domain-containing protein [Reinekea thalattae]|uniref:Uncharacterized protein n=1 Tax=Reinekea thalattae TaxID=2593301 RepID=A0A5C8ZCW4_9GAMM|nr:hypothetical protein [Reinekea thalattae]TXR54746.1 hypothetical protein FME95_09475 [Reinekea thalattae]
MIPNNLLVLLLILFLAGCAKTPSDELQIGIDGLYAAEIQNDGSSLVAGSFKHGGSYWDLRKKSREYSWNHKDGYITDILYTDISDDGRFALTANYYNVVIWHTETGEAISFWEAPGRIESADLSQDGQYIMLGLNNSTAVIFHSQLGAMIAEFQHGGPVGSVAINVSGGFAATGSEDGTAKLWSLEDFSLVKEFPHDNQVSMVKFSDTGRQLLIVPANEEAELWTTQSLRLRSTISLGNYRIYSAQFVGENRLIVGTTHRNIFEFDASNGAKLETYQIGTKGSQSFKSAIVLDVAKQDDRLLAVSSSGYLYIF